MNDKYDAFISYAHSADEMLAPKVQEGLQLFAKPWNKRRALRVFCDEASLSANPDLWSSIETALLGSRWLILLASQPSASSPWVEKEVAAWCQHKAPENILVALTDGDIRWNNATGSFDPDTTSSLPSAARLAMRVEPRVVDLRWTRAEQPATLTLRDPRFAAAVADLAAPLHNVPKDELIGEDRRQHLRLTRWRRATFSGLAVLTVVSLLATFFAFGQRNQARDRANVALSRQLAAQSAELREDSPALAALLAVEAYRTNRTPEAFAALLTIAGRPSIDTVLHGEPVDGTGIAIYMDAAGAAYSKDGKLAAATGMSGDVTVWDVKTGRPTLVVRMSKSTSQLAFVANDRLAVFDRGAGYATWNLRTGAMSNQWLSPPEGVMSADGAAILSTPVLSVGKASPELNVWNTTTHAALRMTFAAPVTAAGLRADAAETAAISGGRLQWLDGAGKALGSIAPPTIVAEPTLTISDDGRTIAGFSDEPNKTANPLSVVLVDTATGTTATVVTDVVQHSLSRFSPDGTKLAVSDGSAVQLVDVKAKKVIADKVDLPAGTIGLAWNQGGTQLLLPSRSGESYLFNVGARRTLAKVLATKGAIAASNPDRTRIAALSDRSLSILDGASGDVVGRSIALDAPAKDEVRAVAINDAGDMIAILSGNELSAYSAKTGSRVGSVVQIDCDWSEALTFDGRTARVFHAPGVVTVVDVKEGRQRHDRPCPAEPPGFAAVDRTGRYAVFGEDDDEENSTKLTWWDLASDRMISDELFLRGDGAYTSPVVSPGGRFVLAGMTVRFVTRVFDLKGDPPTIGALDAFNFPKSPAFSDDGLVVAIGDQSSLGLYDLEHRTNLGTVSDLPGEFNGAVMGPNSESAIGTDYPLSSTIGSPDLVMVDLRPATIIDVACALANRNLTADEQAFYLGSVTKRLTCGEFPSEPRSLQQRKDIPVVSAAVATTRAATTTTRPATATTRAATTTTRR